MLTVTEAGPADRAGLVVLLAEMATWYAERDDRARLAVAAVTLTSPQGLAGPFCLLARQDGVPVGLASLCGFFPAFDFTWGLLLKDIFVAEAARGGGAARALMTAAAGLAAGRGYSRLDWTTDGDNRRAQAFYRRLGADAADKLFYRLEGAALAAAARGDWPERGREGRA